MSEVQRIGPLDRARSINVKAEDLDLGAQLMDEPTSADLELLRQQAWALDRSFPLYKQPVKVVGNLLCWTDDEDEEQYVESSKVEGTHAGFNVLPIKRAGSDYYENRVAHTIAVEEHKFYDKRFYPHHFIEQKYVFATGAKVEPVMPVAAHSFIDLEDDKIIPAIDYLSRSKKDLKHVFHKLGELSFVDLANETPVSRMMGLQRTSYLNSLGLHSGAVVCGKEAIRIPSKFPLAYGQEAELTDPGCEAVAIMPDYFVQHQGYKRTEGGFEPTSYRELFLAEHSSDGKVALLAIRNVLEVIKN